MQGMGSQLVQLADPPRALAKNAFFPFAKREEFRSSAGIAHMYADLGLSSRLCGWGPLRSVGQGSGGAAALSYWTQFPWVMRRPCSCSVPAPTPAPAAAAAAASAMNKDNGQAAKEIVLDREKFQQQLRLRAVRIPKQHAHFVSKALSRFTLERPKLKHVIHDPESSENRLVLLAEHTNESELLEEKLAEIRRSVPVDIVLHKIDLDYKYYSVEQVLKEILPEGWKVPASFETVGHIAHLNLTDELLPYRKIIADVFLDKNKPKIKTIVNKVGTISNEFRVPTWEVLAGDTNLVTEVRQHNATFHLDFGLVYWNSRLEFEHKRLCSHFQPGQIILDMFAGIGPFAIPAAQQGCVVFANDLNPASVQYLMVNSKINKVTGNMKAYNMDAREFMRNLQREVAGLAAIRKVEDEGCTGSTSEQSTPPQIESETPLTEEVGPDTRADRVEKVKQGIIMGKARGVKERIVTGIAISEAKPWELFHHVVMNLPASALEFLDVFRGLLSRDTWNGPMPRVHCYCFMRASETTGDVVKQAETVLGGNIQNPHVWTVRDVAPNKIMLCISFDLPEQIAFRESDIAKQHPVVDAHNPEPGLESSTQARTRVQNKRLRTET